jgi:two-component system, OmpR family, sensor histidine kinase KdpD
MKPVTPAAQVMLAIGAVLLTAALCFPFSDFIGHRSVALILLMIVSVLAMRLHLSAVVIAAVVSALVWDFFFIPPHFTFTISSGEDVLLITMYFIVATLNGIIHYRIRQMERIKSQSDERARAISLYNSLFSSLSHELRTPISSIIGAADMLQEHGDKLSAEQHKALVAEISNGSLRLSEQVENLLNMSRLEAGMIKARKNWCDLNDLMRSATEKTRHESGQHVLEIQIPEHFPLVQLDYGLTEHILQNLLSNVFRHTPAGTRVQVQAQLLQDIAGHFETADALPEHLQSVEDKVSHRLLLQVADNGPGFPEHEIARAFDKFYRFQESQADGTGLGLFIVKGFTEAQGGEVTLHNQPSGGAVFTLEFPTAILPQNIQHGA